MPNASTDAASAEEPPKWSTAAGWEKWHDILAANVQPLTEWFCRATNLAPGLEVLDIACGTGLPALRAASIVAPGGKVVAIDHASEMLAATARNARALGLDNLELLEMSAQELAFADGSFDAVTFSFGLMFCPDPIKAVAEFRRVLKPGGRFAISVWDEMAKSPYFSTCFQSVAQFVATPPPDPKAPGMSRLAPRGELEAVLRAGGLTDFIIEPRPLMFEAPSFEQHWRMFADVAPPVHHAEQTLAPAELARLKQTFAEVLEPYVIDGRIRVTATPLCASGRR